MQVTLCISMELLETKKLGYPSVNSLCSMEATGGHREDIHLSTLHVPAVGALTLAPQTSLLGWLGLSLVSLGASQRPMKVLLRSRGFGSRANWTSTTILVWPERKDRWCQTVGVELGQLLELLLCSGVGETSGGRSPNHSFAQGKRKEGVEVHIDETRFKEKKQRPVLITQKGAVK